MASNLGHSMASNLGHSERDALGKRFLLCCEARCWKLVKERFVLPCKIEWRRLIQTISSSLKSPHITSIFGRVYDGCVHVKTSVSSIVTSASTVFSFIFPPHPTTISMSLNNEMLMFWGQILTDLCKIRVDSSSSEATALVVHGIDVGTGSQEPLHGGVMAFRCCEMQWRPTSGTRRETR